MKFQRKIHSLPHVLKSILGITEKLFIGIKYPCGELVVVNYHSTPKKFNSNFENQVLFFRKNFTIISPADLDSFFNGTYTSEKCNLLFTFDDGLDNNIHALEILNKYGIKALLFIVPEFINAPKNRQKDYYLKNIRPVINSEIDSSEEDFTALSWGALNDLTKQGHMVGSHTYTHTLVADKSSLENSAKEIIGCKKEVESKLGVSVTSFCSINNTLVSTNKKEKNLIEENYKYHFTTFPGLNAENKNPLMIKRRNIESSWLMGAVYFAISKMDLKRWKNVVRKYIEM